MAQPPDPDRAALDALRRADPDALEPLYRRHRDWVLRVARRFCATDADALDAAQETFVALARKPPSLKPGASLRSWLYVVAKRSALAQARARARFVGPDDALLDRLPGPDGASAPDPALAEALRRLPHDQRETLFMRTVHGLSVREAAETLAVPEGTVKSRLHKALDALRADPSLRREAGIDG